MYILKMHNYKITLNKSMPQFIEQIPEQQKLIIMTKQDILLIRILTLKILVPIRGYALICMLFYEVVKII